MAAFLVQGLEQPNQYSLYGTQYDWLESLTLAAAAPRDDNDGNNFPHIETSRP